MLSTLRQAAANGKVIIITNASEGWVQHSASLCMPGLQVWKQPTSSLPPFHTPHVPCSTLQIELDGGDPN